MIHTATNTVTATVPVGSVPYGVAITSDGAYAYVTNAGASNVSVIDTATNTVTATVPVGSGPIGIAIRPLELIQMLTATVCPAIQTTAHGFQRRSGRYQQRQCW